MKKLLLTLTIIVAFFTANAQIRVQGDFGVSTATGDFGADGSLGIGYALNARWMFSEKLDAGLEYDASAIVTVSADGAGDIDATGITGYLAKGYYHFFDKGFSPYFALGLGLYNVELPTITITDSNGNTTTFEGDNNVNFGFAPEVGLKINNFILGAKYTFAGKTPGNQDINATAIRFFLGYKFDFDGIK